MSIISKLLDFFNLEKHNTDEDDTSDSNEIYEDDLYEEEYRNDQIEYQGYFYTTQNFNPNSKCYKLNTLEDIISIPIPTRKFDYNCDFTQSIEYVLQRKATQFKKEGKLDLAIVCLKKAIAIMPYAPMQYPEVYDRLENYLKLAGRFDEARRTHSEHEYQAQIEKVVQAEMHFQFKPSANMIDVRREGVVCENCACYYDRIYTQNGHHGFPDMNIFKNYYMTRKCDCYLSFNLYEYDFFEIIEPIKSKNVKHSNRPFIDDRTAAEKEIYEQRLLRLQTKAKDRRDYDWLCEHFPDKAPKSFGGYRNMKNRNSANYQKLVALAKKYDYII